MKWNRSKLESMNKRQRSSHLRRVLSRYMSGRLRTFCHISEYDEAGYRQLHRLIAASDPLVLWAPSSQFLSDPSVCGISSRDFLNLVENGAVQVVARERWLTDRSFRDGHKWGPAAWEPFIDGTLENIAREDAQRQSDPRKRRVIVAEEESKTEWLPQAREETPAVVAGIARTLIDGSRRGEIPPGTLSTAARAGEEIDDRVEVVLRDAHNHAEAIDIAKARTAILLSPRESVFSRLVTDLFVESEDETEGARGSGFDKEDVVTASHLSRELVELLGRLEVLRPSTDIQAFVLGQGHPELIRWTRRVMHQLRHVPPQRLEEEMAKELALGLEDAEFTSIPVDVAAIPLVGAIFEALMAPAPLAITNLAFGAYPSLRRGAEQLDLIDSAYRGPKWPFRYLFGTGPRRGRHRDLVELLEG
jgi:hypothetical protein